MKFTLSALKEFLDTNASLEEIASCLDSIGLEVEEITDHSKILASFEVAEILEDSKHPSADKLKVCKVKSSEGDLQIVCGAPNARAGIKVVLAKVGTLIPKGEFKIKKSKIRDVESAGMMCSFDELGLEGDSDGIIELDNAAKIGENPAKYLGSDDPIIEIAITPNRGDALGTYGIARDLAAAGIGKFNEPKWQVLDYSKSNIIDDTNDCRAFLQIEIENVENKESPDWLKNYLNSIGLTPISAIVDVTNYICFIYGRPMHAYDRDKLDGPLKVTRARNGEKFSALNDKEYELSGDDLVVRDNSKAQCLAGIIGGSESSCDSSTKNVILEAAFFNKDIVTLMGRKHQIDTDSRYRAERRLDIEMLVPASIKAANLVLEICGGTIKQANLSGSVEYSERKTSIDEETIERLTGAKISIKESAEILERLGFKVSISGSKLEAVIPSWRHDVSIKEDLIEEIVRIRGFDKIDSIPVPTNLNFRLAPNLTNSSNISKRIMANLGYDEVVTFSFMSSNSAKNFAELKDNLYLQNPISSELDYMRPYILPNLLEAIGKNKARSILDGAIFEFGPTFDGTDIKEENIAISAAIWGNVGSDLHKTNREADIYDIKADLEILIAEFGLSLENLQIKTDNLPDFMHPSRSGSLNLGKNKIGYFGEVHPLILKKYDIEKRVCFFEININAIPEKRLKYGRRPDYKPSSFQPNIRDFAFLIDEGKQIGGMEKAVVSIDKNLIKSAEIFDIYRGKGLPEDKKSVAVRVVIQASDHTLSEEELSAIHAKIIASVEKNFEAEIRS